MGLGVAVVFLSLDSVMWYSASRALEGQVRRLPCPSCEFGVIYQKASRAQAPTLWPPAPA